MAWRPKSTMGSGLHEPNKVLLYGHHGWGKTWQVRNFQKRYGNGLLLSGEKGLKSLADVDIPHIAFTSWDGPHDPDNDVYSFRGMAQMLTPSFLRDNDINWLALDSITELSEMLMAWAKKETEGEKNRFAVWALYNEKMIGAIKWIRDLPVHIYVTSLAAEGEDDSGGSDFWPHVHGSKVATAIPANFDHVFCAIKRDVVEGDDVKTKRFIVTEQMRGWHGKARDPFNRLAAVEEVDDITELLDRMTRSKADDEKRAETLKVLEANKAKIEEAAKEKA
jgi:hypothetical protein